MSNEAIVAHHFQTPLWIFEKPEWVKSVNKVCDKYIKEAYKRDEKGKNDFGWSYHSSPLYGDPKLKELHDWVGATAHNFIDGMGYDMTNHSLFYTESWVQEFSKKGGGHHNSHVHGNNHVSAFYYLKCTENTSRPVFHDPRTGAKMMKLPEKDSKQVSLASDKVNYTPKPGTLIFIPAYLDHEYGVDNGKEDFRFIHFNLQAVSNTIFEGVKQ
jgi:uncharacterized protein (TIGR02466 family)